MIKSNYKLVIFDWDGTLFDSVKQIVDSLQWAAAQHQIDLLPDAAKNIIGLGLPEAMHTLFPNHQRLHPQIQAAYGQHYVAHAHTQAWFDGVDGLLSGLSAQKIHAAVATGKNRPGLDRVLTHTNSHERFITTRCAGETKSKPHPLMLEEILQETGVPIEQVVMVGDTTYDLEMAARIGMARIGVSYGAHTVDELNAFEPVGIAHSVADLHKMLLK